MPTLTAQPQVHPDAFATEVDSQAVILQYGTGTYYTLNEVGTRIWHLLEEKKSLQQILAILQQEYSASEAQLQQDLLVLVQQLKEKELLV